MASAMAWVTFMLRSSRCPLLRFAVSVSRSAEPSITSLFLPAAGTLPFPASIGTRVLRTLAEKRWLPPFPLILRPSKDERATSSRAGIEHGGEAGELAYGVLD